MPLTLRAEYLNATQWWFNRPFSVHPKIREHTGALTNLGKDVDNCIYYQQLINKNLNRNIIIVGGHHYATDIFF